MEFDWTKPRGRNSPGENYSREHFMRNAWEPIAVPRWALSLKYALFIVVGLVAFIVGVPTLDITTFYGYTPVWSGFVAIGGILAFIGSLRPSWGIFEAVGASIVVAFLVVLIAALVVHGSLSVAILLLVVCIIPAVRAAFLVTHYTQLRKRGTR